MARREELILTSNDAAAVAWSRATAIDPGTPRNERQLAALASANGVRVAILALEETIFNATAPPAVDVQAVYDAPQPLATWGCLELLGHRVILGYVEEDNLVGRTMLRVRRLFVPDRDRGVGEPDPPLQLEEKWQIYSPASIYSFEPMTEAEARDRYVARHGYSGGLAF